MSVNYQLDIRKIYFQNWMFFSYQLDIRKVYALNGMSVSYQLVIRKVYVLNGMFVSYQVDIRKVYSLNGMSVNYQLVIRKVYSQIGMSVSYQLVITRADRYRPDLFLVWIFRCCSKLTCASSRAEQSWSEGLKLNIFVPLPIILTSLSLLKITTRYLTFKQK
jgi:hypothetical protein